MKPKQIERRFTILAEFYYGMFALMPTILLAIAIAQHSGWAFVIEAVVVISVVGLMTARYIHASRRLKTHNEGLIELAAARGWTIDPTVGDVGLIPELDNASLLLVADRDAEAFNYVKASQWNYLDLSYAVYQQAKGGEYKAATIYYSVMVTKLPRILPNVFFDSKAERGRQFKAKFTKDQRHSLEGNFDQYFDTYFAEGYTTDDMSFVTPDVMQALIDASEFDAEIIEDRLLLYGPIYQNASELPIMADKLLRILQSLQVTASAYRDDRLPAATAGQTVTPEGMFLRRKVHPAWPTIVLLILYIILRIIIGTQPNH